MEQIRDDNIDTYWQSDGAQPHLINIQFHKKMSIMEVALYLDYGHDESYTPKKISIKAGTTFHDLVEVQVVDLHEPHGWVKLALRHPNSAAADAKPEDPAGIATGSMLRAHFLQICIIAMHQNGRDTHIRQAKVFGPRYSADTLYEHSPSVHSLQAACTVPSFTTVEFCQFSQIR